VDIVVQPSLWENPAFVAVVVIAGLSLVTNLILLAVSIL
jgi:hypothetical protein